jgi:hypothetical protein
MRGKAQNLRFDPGRRCLEQFVNEIVEFGIDFQFFHQLGFSVGCGIDSGDNSLQMRVAQGANDVAARTK